MVWDFSLTNMVGFGLSIYALHFQSGVGMLHNCRVISVVMLHNCSVSEKEEAVSFICLKREETGEIKMVAL
ncbi:hypothetical protein ACB092_02G199600 [Castanea dentata]